MKRIKNMLSIFLLITLTTVVIIPPVTTMAVGEQVRIVNDFKGLSTNNKILKDDSVENLLNEITSKFKTPITGGEVAREVTTWIDKLIRTQPQYIDDTSALTIIDEEFAKKTRDAAKGKLDGVKNVLGNLKNEGNIDYWTNYILSTVGDNNSKLIKIEKITVLNKNKIKVKFNEEVDSIKKENFIIKDAKVMDAEISQDKKSVVIEVDGLNYNTKYSMNINFEFNGQKVDKGSIEFSMPSVNDIWNLQIEAKNSSIIANGSDNTELLFKLVNKVTGEIDKKANNIILEINSISGVLSTNRLVIQDGIGKVVIKSVLSTTDISSKIAAKIIDAPQEYKALVGDIKANISITFTGNSSTGGSNNSSGNESNGGSSSSGNENNGGSSNSTNSLNIVSVNSVQADRVVVNFNKDVALDKFIKKDSSGEFLYKIDRTGSDKTKAEVAEIKPDRIAHSLIDGILTVKQENLEKQIKGIRLVAGNSKAIEVILEKSSYLKDNNKVEVLANMKDDSGKVQASSGEFVLSDSKKPEVISVIPEGKNVLKIKYSEAMKSIDLTIDGKFNGANGEFAYEFGEFNAITLEDNRHLATVTLASSYDEDGSKGKTDKLGYFMHGTHSVQSSSAKDFAAITDTNNIGELQNLTFTIDKDKINVEFYITNVIGNIGDSSDTITVTFSDGVQYKDDLNNATKLDKYKLNNQELPIGTTIKSIDVDNNIYGLETIEIKLPKGTLLASPKTNNISVNNKLVSERGTIISKEVEKVFSVEALTKPPYELMETTKGQAINGVKEVNSLTVATETGFTAKAGEICVVVEDGAIGEFVRVTLDGTEKDAKAIAAKIQNTLVNSNVNNSYDITLGDDGTTIVLTAKEIREDRNVSLLTYLETVDKIKIVSSEVTKGQVTNNGAKEVNTLTINNMKPGIYSINFDDGENKDKLEKIIFTSDMSTEKLVANIVDKYNIGWGLNRYYDIKADKSTIIFTNKNPQADKDVKITIKLEEEL